MRKRQTERHAFKGRDCTQPFHLEWGAPFTRLDLPSPPPCLVCAISGPVSALSLHHYQWPFPQTHVIHSMEQATTRTKPDTICIPAPGLCRLFGCASECAITFVFGQTSVTRLDITVRPQPSRLWGSG